MTPVPREISPKCSVLFQSEKRFWRLYDQHQKLLKKVDKLEWEIDALKTKLLNRK